MSMTLPEYNMTGIDYTDRAHLHFPGPIIDFHAHVMRTRPGDPPNGPPLGVGPDASIDQAELMLDVGADFGIHQTVTMCPSDDIQPLRDRFGDRVAFNAMITKKNLAESDDDAYRALDRFLELGIKVVKLWSAPRGRDRGLIIDAPWRIEAVRRARAAGVRLAMVHVADPDVWFHTVYADSAKFGTKPDQYVGLERMMNLFPDLIWIGAHMGGDAEHPDHLQALLEKYPQFYIDTSATKWQVREVSRLTIVRYQPDGGDAEAEIGETAEPEHARPHEDVDAVLVGAHPAREHDLRKVEQRRAAAAHAEGGNGVALGARLLAVAPQDGEHVPEHAVAALLLQHGRGGRRERTRADDERLQAQAPEPQDRQHPGEAERQRRWPERGRHPRSGDSSDTRGRISQQQSDYPQNRTRSDFDEHSRCW